MAGVSDPDHQENQMSRRSEQPTPRQLRYLRTLAERTGTTFASPGTSGEASREIRRLEALRSLTRSERAHERRTLYADRERLRPSSAVSTREISGYGSHARWADRV
jgi:hypothetical protein